MYEENGKLRTRRIIPLALIGLAIIALLWLAVWLIFFRHSNTTKLTPQKPKTSSGTSTAPGSPAPSPTRQSSGSAPTTGTNGNTSTTASPATSSASTTTPALANTGPGDVLTPVILAVVIGTGIQYVRLYRQQFDR